MIISFRERHPEFFEISTRYCPICGKFIRGGQFIHRCSKKALRKLEIEGRQLELRIEKEGMRGAIRTFDDRLREAEDILNLDRL